MAAVLSSLGYRVGDQAYAELLMENWARRDFLPIIQYCQSADAFQDRPFSLDYTYQALDLAYPGSKYILTIRNSAEEWYKSLTTFQTIIIGKNRLPTADDLKNFNYRRKGWLWRTHQLVYGIDESTLYDKKIYMHHYIAHNDRVRHYFRHRQDDLLVINLKDNNAATKLAKFLRVPRTAVDMPHLNKSR